MKNLNLFGYCIMSKNVTMTTLISYSSTNYIQHIAVCWYSYIQEDKNLVKKRHSPTKSCTPWVLRFFLAVFITSCVDNGQSQNQLLTSSAQVWPDNVSLVAFIAPGDLVVVFKFPQQQGVCDGMVRLTKLLEKTGKYLKVIQDRKIQKGYLR